MSKSLADIKAQLPERIRNEASRRAAEIRTEIAGLKSLRHALEQTQAALAARMHTSQANVARMEQRTDLLLSTLRQYVEGLGGQLDLVARFPGQPELRIQGIGDIGSPASTRAGLRKRETMDA